MLPSTCQGPTNAANTWTIEEWSEHGPADEKDEVIATYQAYTRALLANDMDAINDLVLYPLAYVGAGKTVLLDSFPVKPADLIASKQWHTTTDTEFEVVGVSSTKAPSNNNFPEFR